MKLSSPTVILVLLLSTCCFSQDPMPVLGSAWERSVRPGQTSDNSQPGPVRAVIAENKNFRRNQRDQQVNASDPNDYTIDGRSAALEKTVQQSRKIKTDDQHGFSYTASVRNDSGRTAEVIYWEYRFTEHAWPANVTRRQFLCAVKLKNGEKKDLTAFSLLAPRDVIDASALAASSARPVREEAIVNRIEFSDGAILQRPEWKFTDVKKSVERLTSAPWGNEVCWML